MNAPCKRIEGKRGVKASSEISEATYRKKALSESIEQIDSSLSVEQNIQGQRKKAPIEGTECKRRVNARSKKDKVKKHRAQHPRKKVGWRRRVEAPRGHIEWKHRVKASSEAIEGKKSI